MMLQFDVLARLVSSQMADSAVRSHGSAENHFMESLCCSTESFSAAQVCIKYSCPRGCSKETDKAPTEVNIDGRILYSH